MEALNTRQRDWATGEQFLISVRQKPSIWGSGAVFLMGGSAPIRVSSWPLSNFTHQREHHPAAGIPGERGCRNLEGFQRFARRAQSYLNPRGERKKKRGKSSMIFLMLWIFDIHAAAGRVLAFAHPPPLPLLLFFFSSALHLRGFFPLFFLQQLSDVAF